MDTKALIEMYISQHFISDNINAEITEFIKPLIGTHSYSTIFLRYFNPKLISRRCNQIVRFFYRHLGLVLVVEDVVSVYMDYVEQYFNCIFEYLDKSDKSDKSD